MGKRCHVRTLHLKGSLQLSVSLALKPDAPSCKLPTGHKWMKIKLKSYLKSGFDLPVPAVEFCRAVVITRKHVLTVGCSGSECLFACQLAGAQGAWGCLDCLPTLLLQHSSAVTPFINCYDYDCFNWILSGRWILRVAEFFPMSFFSPVDCILCFVESSVHALALGFPQDTLMLGFCKGRKNSSNLFCGSMEND